MPSTRATQSRRVPVSSVRNTVSPLSLAASSMGRGGLTAVPWEATAIVDSSVKAGPRK